MPCGGAFLQYLIENPCNRNVGFLIECKSQRIQFAPKSKVLAPHSKILVTITIKKGPTETAKCDLKFMEVSSTSIDIVNVLHEENLGHVLPFNIMMSNAAVVCFSFKVFPYIFHFQTTYDNLHNMKPATVRNQCNKNIAKSMLPLRQQFEQDVNMNSMVEPVHQPVNQVVSTNMSYSCLKVHF